MKAGRVVAIVIGSILGVIGLGLLIVGIAGTVAYGVARDDDGGDHVGQRRPRRSAG